MKLRFVFAWVFACVACDDSATRGRDDAAVDSGADDVAVDSHADDVAVDSGADDVAVDSGVPDVAVDSGVPDVAVDSGVPDVAVDSGVPDVAVDSVVPDVANDIEAGLCGGVAPACSARRPVILVHGINGGPENFDVMAQRLVAAGWPEDEVVRFEAADPSWGCNVDNAAALATLVEETRARTCQGKVDVVAHSMGTLSSRYYLKDLGGTAVVNTYVTLGGMHHGLLSPCFAPDFLGVCVWTELCALGSFITELNADPATPGPTRWVSIYGTADETVSNDSSHLDGAENIAIEGAEHDGANGLLQREDAFAEVLRALGDPCH